MEYNYIEGIDDRIAGFWRRFFAYITDLIIIQILYSILLFIGFLAVRFGTEDFNTYPSSDLILSLAIPFFLIYLLLFLTYFTTFFSIGGQTPGKMIFGMKVVTRNGDSIGLGFSLLRSFGYFASIFFFGLGFLIALFNKRRRALHDFLSVSYVIRSSRIMEIKGDGSSPQISPNLSEPLICVLLSLSIIFPAAISSGEVVERVIATVNNDVISLSDLKRHMVLYLITNKGIDFDKAKNNALQDLIDERLILAEASRFGIDEPSDDEIQKEAKKLERDLGGHIVVKEKLSWYGLEFEDLYALLSSRLIIKRFIDQRINLFILISPEEVESYMEKNKEKFKGISKEDARMKITRILTDERSKEKIRELNARLRAKADIRINIEG